MDESMLAIEFVIDRHAFFSGRERAVFADY